MCIVKIDVSTETMQAFDGHDDEQEFEVWQEETEQEKPNQKQTMKSSEEMPKVKEVVIDFG